MTSHAFCTVLSTVAALNAGYRSSLCWWSAIFI